MSIVAFIIARIYKNNDLISSPAINLLEKAAGPGYRCMLAFGIIGIITFVFGIIAVFRKNYLILRIVNLI